MISAGLQAGRMQELKYKSCRDCNDCKDFLFRDWKQARYIVYAGIEASKKDCLCKDLRIISGLPGQGNKYNIPYFKVLLEAIFSEMVWANKKVFIFQQGNCMMNILHPSVKIICFEHLQQGSYEKLNPVIFFQEYIQPDALHVANMIAFWKIITVFCSSNWNFSSPHNVTYFVHQRLQKFMEKVNSKVK